ncbi:hypothetical protein [Maridesulfovibrio sp. FT414]|uniref:hypothetical protein n=1 Tax=Maridesulfovibrio sp. FT414 TaxID=2979469 RepID=UPI003D8078DD
MHTRLSDVYLNPDLNGRIEEACQNLGISKSLFLNVLLGELFSKAGPEDLFYNRVKLCEAEERIGAAIKDNRRVTQ